MNAPSRASQLSWAAQVLGLAVWGVGWASMVWLDGRLDLANLALVFVLTSVLSALWWPAWVSVPVTLAAALAFNWWFVPPRGTLAIELHQHALLLVSMVAVSVVVAILVVRLRRQALALHVAVTRSEQLRTWGEILSVAVDPLVHVSMLC